MLSCGAQIGQSMVKFNLLQQGYTFIKRTGQTQFQMAQDHGKLQFHEGRLVIDVENCLLQKMISDNESCQKVFGTYREIS